MHDSGQHGTAWRREWRRIGRSLSSVLWDRNVSLSLFFCGHSLKDNISFLLWTGFPLDNPHDPRQRKKLVSIHRNGLHNTIYYVCNALTCMVRQDYAAAHRQACQHSLHHLSQPASQPASQDQPSRAALLDSTKGQAQGCGRRFQTTSCGQGPDPPSRGDGICPAVQHLTYRQLSLTPFLAPRWFRSGHRIRLTADDCSH